MLIKFHAVSDLSCGYYLELAEAIFRDFDENKLDKDYSINEVIQMYNICQYIDNELYLQSWDSDTIKLYTDKVKLFKEIIRNYFVNLVVDDLQNIYLMTDKNYVDDFWQLVCQYGVYKKIDCKIFECIISKDAYELYRVLFYKQLVAFFGNTIRSEMLLQPKSAEFLLNKFEVKNRTDIEIYIPKEITKEDKEQIILTYIDSPNVNLNYLNIISNIKNSKDKIAISTETKLKAKKRLEIEAEKTFNSSNTMATEVEVVFHDTQSEAVEYKMVGSKMACSCSKKWFMDNLDYPTLFNNFIYLFEFVDSQMRCLLVSSYKHMGVFERYAFMRSENSYIDSFAFNGINTLSTMQIKLYYDFLMKNNIRIESMIEWFFESYLSTEFGAKEFKLAMPSEHSTIMEKCTLIMPAMENILKQFSLYVKDKHIDFDLLDIQSESMNYETIPSFSNKKYVYGCGEEYKTITNILFSDQSGLSYCRANNKSYKNLYERILTDKIEFALLEDFRQNTIKYLIDKKYIHINNDGFIDFVDMTTTNVLKDLYENEVISYWNVSDSIRTAIKKLETEKMVKYGSSLFSKQESDYINYFLNKSKFNNGPDLRNKYNHSQPFSKKDEGIHAMNYMIMLKIFIITVIKINDEFCIMDRGTNVDKGSQILE